MSTIILSLTFIKGKPNLSEKISRSPDGLGLAESEPSGRGKRKFCRWSKIILVFEGKFGLPSTLDI